VLLKVPVIFNRVKFPGNLPGNLREVVTSSKVTGKSQMLQNQAKWRPEADSFVSQSYHRRPFLADMADCEVIERFRLPRARMEWLVEEFKEKLERNTVSSCTLAPKT